MISELDITFHSVVGFKVWVVFKQKRKNNKAKKKSPFEEGGGRGDFYEFKIYGLPLNLVKISNIEEIGFLQIQNFHGFQVRSY
jgi:hypothetical protein